MRKVVLTVLYLVVLGATPVAAEEFEHNLVLYGWLSGLDGTIGVADAALKPVDATFKDLAGYLDFAMAGHFEGRKTKGLYVVDVAYTKLSSERDGTIQKQPVSLNMDLAQWIVEGGGGYRVTPEFDVLLVGRYYHFGLGTTTTSIAGTSSTDNSQDWADFYVGARYSRLVKEKWFFSIRGDVGTGGSKLAWFGNIAAGYRFNETVSLAAAWRVLSLDKEPDLSGDYFAYDMTQDGLGVGLGFSF